MVIGNIAGKEDFQPLDERSLNPDPIKQFQKWFDEVRKPERPDLDAMAVATATKNGKVSVRMMLLKDVDSDGFVFYTNYNSPKARELEANPFAAIVFYWPELGRQVRIEGSAEKVTAEESDEYFRTRPRESQIGAHASTQSEVLGSREELVRRFEELRRQYEGRTVPRPAHWGGYRVKPSRIEFWQARVARLNDRIVYELQKDGRWTMKRLSP